MNSYANFSNYATILKPDVSKSTSMFHTFGNYVTILVPKEKKNAQPKYIIEHYTQNALLF